ncbi:MAG: methyltransferase [Candidatus Buchananbacteria bacterium]
MKPYQKILEQQEKGHFFVIQHIWGQSDSGVYNELVDVWNEKAGIDDNIFILSKKYFGLRSVVKTLKKMGVIFEIVGKGEDETRLIKITKDNNRKLEPIIFDNFINFKFAGLEYKVDAGQAIFSRNKLDEGTEFLLKTALEHVGDLNGKAIGDLGGGWGAISLILGTTFPQSQIIAFENEFSSIKAFSKNVEDLHNITLFNSDIASLTDENIQKYYNKLDYIISNPPLHVTTKQREDICQNMGKFIKKGGEIFVVTEGRFISMYEKQLASIFKITGSFDYKRFRVFQCVK